MTEPETHTLDAPGAVLHYDVRRNDASTRPSPVRCQYLVATVEPSMPASLPRYPAGW